MRYWRWGEGLWSCGRYRRSSIIGKWRGDWRGWRGMCGRMGGGGLCEGRGRRCSLECGRGGRGGQHMEEGAYARDPVLCLMPHCRGELFEFSLGLRIVCLE